MLDINYTVTHTDAPPCQNDAEIWVTDNEYDLGISFVHGEAAATKTVEVTDVSPSVTERHLGQERRCDGAG